MPQSVVVRFLVLALFVLAGCQAGSGYLSPAAETSDGSGLLTVLAEDVQGDIATNPGTKSGARPAENAAPERMLIQRGQMRIEVVHPDDSSRAFLEAVKGFGGYLAQQSGRTLTVRVPAARFDEAFAALRAMGRVLDESREASDVTEEFQDLGIRLDTARKARERLLEVLQKAETVDDILRVEVELRRLTEEIERMEGRAKFLADQVAMATLQATFVPKSEPPPPQKRTRQRSRYAWINEAGPESLLEGN